MSDLLREALERIEALDLTTAFGLATAGETAATIAREALAIEPEYEYVAVTTAAGGSPIRWSTFSGTYRECVERFAEWSGYGPKWVERRVKAGPWERVDR